MSTGTADLRVETDVGSSRGSTMSGLRVYFVSDSRRTVQTVLGLIWLLDGGCSSSRSCMAKGSSRFLTGMTAGQPGWVSSSVNWGAHTLHGAPDLFNTGFALVQIVIGLGLLYRPTVKPALAASFGWVLVVWWFGEAFGMMFMTRWVPRWQCADRRARSGAALRAHRCDSVAKWTPRRVVRCARRASRGAALWLVMAWLWLEAGSGASG